ncbi:MAG: hypothetical protein EPN92_12950 [Chitinophagaceae bacterium]|nr:MAG: hypothetical protein EPN92_12950 [Chitinophagaceae bacterium]
MFKKLFFQGISAGILSAVACIIYNRIYFFATEVDFSKVVNVPVLVGINLLACLLAAAGYWAFKKLLKKNADIFFNLTFTILSFASVIFPISISLPLDIKFPELFPGLTVPMHFFPALAWFTIRPLFIKEPGT